MESRKSLHKSSIYGHGERILKPVRVVEKKGFGVKGAKVFAWIYVSSTAITHQQNNNNLPGIRADYKLLFYCQSFAS